MKRAKPKKQLKVIVDTATERFRIARSEVFTSIKEHEFDPVTITNDMVALRATELAKLAGDEGNWIAHIEEARQQLDGESNESE